MFAEIQQFDVSAFEARISLDYHVTASTFVRADLDNSLLSYNGGSYLIPFYQLAVGQKLSRDVEFMLALNNKVINYDKNFPTFYATDSPYLLLRIYKRLGFMNVNDERHRR